MKRSLPVRSRARARAVLFVADVIPPHGLFLAELRQPSCSLLFFAEGQVAQEGPRLGFTCRRIVDPSHAHASDGSAHAVASHRFVASLRGSHLDEVECADPSRGTPSHCCFDVGDVEHSGSSQQFLPRRRHASDVLLFPTPSRTRRAGAGRTVRLLSHHLNHRCTRERQGGRGRERG